MNFVHFVVLNKDSQVTYSKMFRTLFLVGISSYDTILVHVLFNSYCIKSFHLKNIIYTIVI